MDIFTLYVGQGSLAAVRAGNEAVIVDAHMPECDDVTSEQIEKSLDHCFAKSNVRGLILTGLDRDHACPTGVESILTDTSRTGSCTRKFSKTRMRREMYLPPSRATKNGARARRDHFCANRCAWIVSNHKTSADCSC